MLSDQHQPVLLKEVLENLAIKPDGIYIDGTFGRGGHARAILENLGEKGRLLAFDKDPAAIEAAENEIFFSKDKRFCLRHGSFTLLKTFAEEEHIKGKVSGILLDLGVSSPQLDNAQRGFSFMREGALDMRMDPSRGISAAEWLQDVSENTLADVLKDYGEERYARRIAHFIVKAREQNTITTTTQLAEIIAKAHPRWDHHKHPATRSFQAIRIFINQELDDLATVLEQCLEVLAIRGRLLVISFHSLEDRLVKHFMQKKIQGEILPRDLPIRANHFQASLRKITPAIKPSDDEIKLNPRARSAVLRVVEKIK